MRLSRFGSCVVALAGAWMLNAHAAAQAAEVLPGPQDGASAAQPAPGAAQGAGSGLEPGQGLVMLDYMVVPVPRLPTLDLMGFQLLNRVSEGLYVGVGAYAPLLKGEYGGFMAFDVSAHVQQRVWQRVFANAGLAAGGGGGGKSTAQSAELSGTGGFVKVYGGLGLDLDAFTFGANLARIRFTRSAIDHTQLNVFVQLPFSYKTGAFADFGQRLNAADSQTAFAESSANTLTLGLDNYRQINPKGSNTSTIRLVDLQFAHDLGKHSYWYASLGVGYRGMPLYNQFMGGLGHRFELGPRISLHAQLGLGSGGYAPEKIDTGAGMLVYPKLTAEYALTKDFGLALSSGYMFSVRGSSRNYTFGASLNYHLRSRGPGAGDGAAPAAATLTGYRFSLLQQTETDVNVRGEKRPHINLLTAQLDTMVSDHFYLPVRAGVAYNAYLGYPGYGELLAGLGVQSKFNKGDSFHFFAQLLAGTNVHGLIVSPGVGMNYSLGDQLAVHVSASKTKATASDNGNFRASSYALGLSYRFSVPSW